MNEQAQQIALCEWMGWKRLESNNPKVTYWNSPEEHRFTQYEGFSVLPNTNSLDVLHEMEKKLTTNELKDLFVRYLLVLLDVPLPSEGNPLLVWYKVVNASAPQRREALLRTLNLWKD